MNNVCNFNVATDINFMKIYHLVSYEEKKITFGLQIAIELLELTLCMRQVAVASQN